MPKIDPYAKDRWANLNFGEAIPGDAELSQQISALMEKRNTARRQAIVTLGLADGAGNKSDNPDHIVLSRWGFVVDKSLGGTTASSGKVRYDASAIAAALKGKASTRRKR